ncbi:MAG: hypothetical protein JST16_07385 [Bdellovibrionales bacterium]|nr:hypothetical protein [Bdellovibrionales bacterium]
MSLFLKSLLTGAFRLFVVFVVFTAMGQIPYRGETVESRYHQYVNSESFQQGFTVAARPITWTTEKVADLIRSAKDRGGAR